MSNALLVSGYIVIARFISVGSVKHIGPRVRHISRSTEVRVCQICLEEERRRPGLSPPSKINIYSCRIHNCDWAAPAVTPIEVFFMTTTGRPAQWPQCCYLLHTPINTPHVIMRTHTLIRSLGWLGLMSAWVSEKLCVYKLWSLRTVCVYMEGSEENALCIRIN